MRNNIPLQATADVLVCGGGLSGCLAALGAARSGCSVVLLERAGMLGGVAMTSMMNSMTNMFMNDQNQQVIRGIAGELMDEAARRELLSPLWRDNEYRQIRYDLEGMHQLLLDQLWGAGVRIYTHAWAEEAMLEGGVCRGVIAQTRAGKRAFAAKAVVDASGDIDVVASCGEDMCDSGNPGAATLLFELIGVDMQRLYEYFKANPDNYDATKSERIFFEAFERNWLEKGMFHLLHGGGVAVKPLQEAIARGEYHRENGLAVRCDALALFGTKQSGRMLVNSNFFELDELDRLEDICTAELSARKICMDLYRTLKRVMPGFEHAELTHIGTELGCRRSRYLRGQSRLERIDVAQQYDDVIGVAPVIDFNDQNGLYGPGTIDLPYGSIVPRRVDNLLVGTAKCFSATWDARHYMRLQPVCMLLGQSAGTAAALAAKTGSARRLDVRALQRELLRGKVWLGDEKRLAALGLA